MIKRFFGVIAGLAVLALMVGASILIANSNPSSPTTDDTTDYSKFEYKTIAKMASSSDYDDINPDSIVAASEITGNIPERIIGNPNAKILIYEFADYACSHCAEMNTFMIKLVEEYKGKVAVVYRGFLLNNYPNNVEAAAAVNAAAIQGYWDKYKNLVFSDQATWLYLKGDKVLPYFGNLFVEASDGQGDLEKFYADMASEAVAKKMAFDHSMGEKVELTGTPTFRINGEKVVATDLQTTIDTLLAS